MNDNELTAMQTILSILEDLDDDAKKRVIAWASDRVGLPQAGPKNTGRGAFGQRRQGNKNGVSEFPTFAELFDAVSPTTNGEKVLSASYWLQVCSGQEQYTSQSVNKELQDLGYALKNVTQGFNALKAKKPAFAIQVKKSGKTQQARKLYKLTQAGIEAVNTMIRPSAE